MNKTHQTYFALRWKTQQIGAQQEKPLGSAYSSWRCRGSVIPLVASNLSSFVDFGLRRLELIPRVFDALFIDEEVITLHRSRN